jgi:archaellum component FlaG (FlaF/FlaG flagellin family)
MKAISQLIVSILLVGVALAAGSILSYVVTETLSTYTPSQIMISRIGDVEVELSRITTSYYSFDVSTKLVNLGSELYTISSGYITILVKGTTGRGKVYSCSVRNSMTLEPGAIQTLKATCIISKSDLQTLFGTQSPPADTVKQSISFLYLNIMVSSGIWGRFAPWVYLM